MTTTQPHPVTARPDPARAAVQGSSLLRMFRTTDLKMLGIMYLSTTFGFFLVGGVMALRMRTELARPGLQFVYDVFKSYRYGIVADVDDPWGYRNSPEWATSCPPPRHNVTELPRIRSERPAFELHYPHMVERMRLEAHIGRRMHQPATTTAGSESGGGNGTRV